MKLHPTKCLVLYAMTIVPMGGVLGASAMSDPRIGFVTNAAGFVFGCFGAALLGGIATLYVLGVRFLASDPS